MGNIVAIIYGCAGASVEKAANEETASAARRGAYFERVVAEALQRWADSRPDKLHIFHDLVRLNEVRRPNGKFFNLANANIDHVVLTGARFLLVDSKGCGRGVLRYSAEAGGELVRPDGTTTPQPWMNNAKSLLQRRGRTSALGWPRRSDGLGDTHAHRRR
ncbi:nuclease-related domain-containing protein [Actinophytocola sp.]|uniref:nuclease-related domain-containing protein n=1 Tax=Actinophytocola sp. TaxID=1872138 RepID=UPI003D6C6F3F